MRHYSDWSYGGFGFTIDSGGTCRMANAEYVRKATPQGEAELLEAMIPKASQGACNFLARAQELAELIGSLRDQALKAKGGHVWPPLPNGVWREHPPKTRTRSSRSRKSKDT